MTNKPTRNDNILDLMVTTKLDLILDLETYLGMSDHNAVTYNVNVTAKWQKKPDRYIYQYRKGDPEEVKRDLGAFRDNFLSEDPLKRSVSDGWNLVKDTLVSSMKKNIPQKKITSRWNFPWMIPQIKRLCRKNKRAWDAGIQNITETATPGSVTLNSIQESYRTYVDNILNTSTNENPKKLYSYIKQKKSRQSNIPVLKSDGNLLSEPTEVAEALNPQYTSQFTREPDGRNLPDIDI